MKALALIAEYQTQHTGKSNYLDHRLKQIKIAIQDGLLCREEGEPDWFTSNLYIAFTLAENTLKALPQAAAIRDEIAGIYSAISKEIKP